MASEAASKAAAKRSLTYKQRREEEDNSALLTLNTLLHTFVGSTLTIDLNDDRTVRGRLVKADNYGKYAAAALRAPLRICLN